MFRHVLRRYCSSGISRYAHAFAKRTLAPSEYKRVRLRVANFIFNVCLHGNAQYLYLISTYTHAFGKRALAPIGYKRDELAAANFTFNIYIATHHISNWFRRTHSVTAHSLRSNIKVRAIRNELHIQHLRSYAAYIYLTSNGIRRYVNTATRAR